MKKVLVIILSAILISPVMAEATLKKTNNTHDGIFKKKHNGDIVQYDKKGKKIGVYKVINGRYIKIK